jgi:KDO2-lipid IV(A) lauroyltransferase
MPWRNRFLLKVIIALPKASFLILYPIYSSLKKHQIKRVENRLRAFAIDKNPKDYYTTLWKNSVYTLKALKQKKTIPISKPLRDSLNIAKPTLAFGIHQGCFELMHQALTRSSKKIYVAVASHNNQDTFLENLRHHPSITFFNLNNLTSTIRKVEKENQILAILVDQGKTLPSDFILLNGIKNPIWFSIPKYCEKRNWQGLLFNTLLKDNLSIEHSILNDNSTWLKQTETWWNKQIQKQPMDQIWHYPKSFPEL